MAVSEQRTQAQGAGRIPTWSEVRQDTRENTPGTWARRAFMALLVVVVVAGVLGVFGVRSRTAATRPRHGVTLSVHYAATARAGLEVPFQITVHRPASAQGPVVLAVSSHYLDLFDVNQVAPQPDSETSDADTVIWHFDAPPTRTFVVTVDLEVQGGRHRGASGFVVLERESGAHLARVTFTTHLAP